MPIIEIKTNDIFAKSKTIKRIIPGYFSFNGLSIGSFFFYFEDKMPCIKISKSWYFNLNTKRIYHVSKQELINNPKVYQTLHYEVWQEYD